MRMIAHPRPLGWKAESIATLRLAGPLALANLLQMLTYAVDVMFIARLGTNELAASSLAISIFAIMLSALSGLMSAVSPIAAAELGARAPALRPIRRTVRMALWLGLGFSVLGILLCTQAEAIMLLTGQQPEIAALGGTYITILMWSILPMVLSMVLRNFVSALGKPFFATAITGLAVVVNTIANYALIFGNLGAPALGLEGAAIATGISTTTVFFAYVLAIRLDAGLHRYHVFGFFWRPDWQRLRELVRIGLPISFTVLAEVGVFSAAAFLMGLFGAAQLAAHTLAIQLVALAFMVPAGVGQAATIRVGYFLGAREPEGIRQAGWSSIFIGTGFMALSATTLLLAPDLLFRLYLDPDDPANAAVIGFALSYTLVCAAFQLFDGLQVVCVGVLRGLQDTRVPMWIAIFSYWVPGFGLAVGLGFFTPLEDLGIWIGLAAGLVSAALMLLYRWHGRERFGLLQSV